MKLGTPELRDRLAAEYVLGTLRGPARRRFDRMLQDDAGAKDAVVAWDARLNALALAARPIAPPTRVWDAIARQIAVEESAAADDADPTVRASVPARRGPAEPGRLRLALWRVLALGASAAALVLFAWIKFLAEEPAISKQSHVALLGSGEEPAWLIAVDADAHELRVTPVTVPPRDPGKTFELWLVADGGAPHSIGILPTVADGVLPHRKIAADGLDDAVLAVSVEPAGGSPTGQPTGPVLFHAALLPPP